MENIMPRKRSLTPKTTECMVQFIHSAQKQQIYIEGKISGCQGLCGGGDGECLFIAMGFFLGDENVLKSDSGDGCTTLNVLKATELYTLTRYIYGM